jgi:hypothetical protein
MIGFQGMRPDRMSRWHTVMDLNFKGNCWTAGALTENAGALTVLNGNEYHCYVRNTTDNSWTQTDDTGMVVDVGGGTAGKNRLTIKVPYFQPDQDGRFPRIRASASFSGLTTSSTTDYIGVGITGYYVNNANPKNPHAVAIYDTNNKDTPTFKFGAQSTKGNWGQTGSGLETTGLVGAHSATTGVLVLEDGGQGLWICRGHEGDVIIKSGNSVDAFQSQVTAVGFNGYTTDRAYYRADTGTDYDGPYVSLWCNAGATGGSQAVTWEQLIVEVYY